MRYDRACSRTDINEELNKADGYECVCVFLLLMCYDIFFIILIILSLREMKIVLIFDAFVDGMCGGGMIGELNLSIMNE